MSTPGATLEVGSVVGHTYEVVSLLGAGGMGEVWLATHRRLPGKKVALKVLRADTGALTDEVRARFRREAEIAARLSHPNIVEVHDFNTLPSGEPYLVMESLVGESLAERLRRGPLSVMDAQAIVRQVGSALAAAHAVGVIHRDLKPDNIFLVREGDVEKVKVLDFGISKIQGSQSVMTQEAALIGTPQYMAPEQVTGASDALTPRLDVFALGAIAYEMVSGARPFQEENIAKLLYRIAHEPHAPLTTRLPSVPEDYARAVESALVKNPDHRCADVETFVRVATGTALPARPAVAAQADGDFPKTLATPRARINDDVGLAQTAQTPPAAKVTAAPRKFRFAIPLGVVALIGLGKMCSGAKVDVDVASASKGAPSADEVRVAKDIAQSAVRFAAEIESSGEVAGGLKAAAQELRQAADEVKDVVAAPLAAASRPLKAAKKHVYDRDEAEERQRLSDLNQRLVTDPDSVARQAKKLKRDLVTEGGRSRASALLTMAQCARNSEEAFATFRSITRVDDTQEVKAYCKSKGWPVGEAE